MAAQDMRSRRFGWVVAVAVLTGSAAHAQFANKRIGFELGGMSFKDNEIKAGLLAQLEGSYYIENGFEVGLRVPFYLFFTVQSNRQLFGTGGQLYVRYLISEEALRPWVGVDLDVAVVLRPPDPAFPDQQQTVFWGPGITAGLDYFLADTVSIGIRPFFTLYIALNNNQPVRPGFGGSAAVHFYF
jgi:outer membrane protein